MKTDVRINWVSRFQEGQPFSGEYSLQRYVLLYNYMYIVEQRLRIIVTLTLFLKILRLGLPRWPLPLLSPSQQVMLPSTCPIFNFNLNYFWYLSFILFCNRLHGFQSKVSGLVDSRWMRYESSLHEYDLSRELRTLPGRLWNRYSFISL